MSVPPKRGKDHGPAVSGNSMFSSSSLLLKVIYYSLLRAAITGQV